MKIIPYIDIVGDERIDHILSDPDNFVWEATSSENLDGWAPDFGLTYYDRPSVYRQASIASSGMASSLRHRFWDTIEGKTDHTGMRYIGLVIYTFPDQICPMEFHLGADEIGRIEPKRHDNRRHLIVVDEPVEFIGEMEVFHLVAPGPGTYRIETLALIRNRPEPTPFVPEIKYLDYRLLHGEKNGDDTVPTEINFITTEPARCKMEVEEKRNGAKPFHISTEELTRLHGITFPDLSPDRHYSVKVEAIERDGDSATKTIEVYTSQEEAGISEPITIPVEAINLDDVAMDEMPLTFAVPLAEGKLWAPETCLLQGGDDSVVGQVSVHSRWPDGSARWALVDAPLPGNLPSGPSSQLEVLLDPEFDETAEGLSWKESEETLTVTSDQLRVSMNRSGEGVFPLLERRDGDGGWSALISQESAPKLILGNGVELKPGKIEGLAFEESGPRRCVIRYLLPYEDGNGIPHLQSTIRFHIYGDTPAIRVVHRLEVISPMLAPTVMGNRPSNDPRFDELRPALDGEEGEAASLINLRSFVWHLERRGKQKVVLGSQEYSVANGSHWRLVHEDDLSHRIEHDSRVERVEGRNRGHLLIETNENRVGLAVRNFWETYPKSIGVQKDAITVELLPPLSEEDPPGDEEVAHRLYFWRKGNQYRLKAGMALTSEILLSLPQDDDESRKIFAWFEQPPVVRPNLDYVNSTAALYHIPSKTETSFKDYEAMIDAACDEWFRDREIWRQYGFLNFGDWYGESNWSWGNNEYDSPFCHYLEFLRGGDPRWFVLGGQATRHLADVDTCNYSSDPSQLGGQYVHIPGHAGGYLPPYFRSKMKGSTSLPAHSWVEGPVLHYLLTGDQNLRETLEHTGRWLTEGMNYFDYMNARECGWHITHLCMLARMTDNPRYLNACRIVVDKVLEKQNESGGWVHMLKEGHCACGYPRCMGEATFMIGVLLGGLRRYHELTGEERIEASIFGAIDWLFQNNFDEESGLFRYTTCLNRGSGGDETNTVSTLEGISYAYRLRPDPRMKELLGKGLEVTGEPRKASTDPDHNGFGKDLCMEMRRVPMILTDF